MPEPHVVAIAFSIAIFIAYLVYKYNLLGDGKGEVGTRQPDSDLEKYIFKHLSRKVNES